MNEWNSFECNVVYPWLTITSIRFRRLVAQLMFCMLFKTSSFHCLFQECFENWLFALFCCCCGLLLMLECISVCYGKWRNVYNGLWRRFLAIAQGSMFWLRRWNSDIIQPNEIKYQVRRWKPRERERRKDAHTIELYQQKCVIFFSVV